MLFGKIERGEKIMIKHLLCIAFIQKYIITSNYPRKNIWVFRKQSVGLDNKKILKAELFSIFKDFRYAFLDILLLYLIERK